MTHHPWGERIIDHHDFEKSSCAYGKIKTSEAADNLSVNFMSSKFAARRTGRGDLEQSRLASSGPKTQIFRICRALCLLPSQIQPRFNSNRKPRRLLQIYAKLCRSRRSTRAAHLRPIQRGMLQFVGFEVLAPQIIYGPVRMDDSQRKELLAAYTERLRNIANETPFDVGIY